MGEGREEGNLHACLLLSRVFNHKYIVHRVHIFC